MRPSPVFLFKSYGDGKPTWFLAEKMKPTIYYTDDQLMQAQQGATA